MTTPSPTPCRTCCDPSCAGEGLVYNTTTHAYDVQVAPGGGIALGPTGLSVTGSETVIQAGPGIDLAGNGTGATPYVVSSAPSTDPGNLLALGTDGNHVLTCAAVVACPGVVQVVQGGPGTDVTGSGTAADPYIVAASPSTDPGNATVLGTDGNLFTPAATTAITAGAGVDVTGTGAPATPYVVSASPSTDPGNLLGLGADNNLSITCDDVAACTQIDAGPNVTVTGTGTTADPYVIGAAGGAAPVINGGDGIDVTGAGTALNPFVVATDLSADPNNIATIGADGGLYVPDTVVVDDPASPHILVTGAGTTASPYVVSEPPQVTPRARVRSAADVALNYKVGGGDLVLMGVVTYDRGGMFAGGPGTGNLVVPAGWDGIYHMGANVQFRGFPGEVAPALRAAFLRRNGGTILAYAQVPPVQTGGDSTMLNLNTDYELVAGDTIGLYVQWADGPIPGPGYTVNLAASGEFSAVLWSTFLHR